MNKPKLLLHACCSCCSMLVPQILSSEFDVTIFYFNPNIHPKEEYDRRLADLKKIASLFNYNIIECKYNPKTWFEQIKGLESEKEGGLRCKKCFEFRLSKTAEYALENNFDCFCTTLTVGRNKKAEIINPIGMKIAQNIGIEFIERNFKKKGVLDESCRLSDVYNITRQFYCGCVFSMNSK